MLRIVAPHRVVQAHLNRGADHTGVDESPKLLDGANLRMVVTPAEIEQRLVTPELVEYQVPGSCRAFHTRGIPVRLNVRETVVELMELCFDGGADRPLIDAVAISQFAAIQIERHIQHTFSKPQQSHRSFVCVSSVPGGNSGLGALNDAGRKFIHIGCPLVIVGYERVTPGVAVSVLDRNQWFTTVTIVRVLARMHIAFMPVVGREPSLAFGALHFPRMLFGIEDPGIESTATFVDLVTAFRTTFAYTSTFALTQDHETGPRHARAGGNVVDIFVRSIGPPFRPTGYGFALAQVC